MRKKVQTKPACPTCKGYEQPLTEQYFNTKNKVLYCANEHCKYYHTPQGYIPIIGIYTQAEINLRERKANGG